jgi:hypothetical protein
MKTLNVKHGTRHHSILWGGASKGVIFTIFMQRAGAQVDFVVDINPAKQGKYLAAIGLRVFSPEEVLSQIEPGANIFVMNGNYLGNPKFTHNQFNYLTVDHETFEQEMKSGSPPTAKMRACVCCRGLHETTLRHSIPTISPGSPSVIQYPQDISLCRN